MARSKFEEHLDRVLLIYDGGIICFGRDGWPKWRHDPGGRYDWLYDGVRYGLVNYHSEREGAWAYKLATGERLQVAP
jgi:hypothetical protein